MNIVGCFGGSLPGGWGGVIPKRQKRARQELLLLRGEKFGERNKDRREGGRAREKTNSGEDDRSENK